MATVTLTDAEAARLGLEPSRRAPRYRLASRMEERQYNGVTYHSAAEATMAWELDCRLRAGEIRGWQRQQAFPLVVNGVHITTYHADFVITPRTGRVEVLEVKGKTAPWRKEQQWKWKLFVALYGDTYQCTFVTV